VEARQKQPHAAFQLLILSLVEIEKLSLHDQSLITRGTQK
jgi:hypothetical protein